MGRVTGSRNPVVGVLGRRDRRICAVEVEYDNDITQDAQHGHKPCLNLRAARPGMGFSWGSVRARRTKIRRHGDLGAVLPPVPLVLAVLVAPDASSALVEVAP